MPTSCGALRKLVTGHGNNVSGMAFSPDGKICVTASLDHTIKLWDVPSFEELRTLRGHTDGVTGIVFLDGGRSLATSSSDAIVKIWDVASGRERATLKGHAAMANDITWSPEQNMLATADYDQGVKLWRTASETDVGGDLLQDIAWLTDADADEVGPEVFEKAMALANKQLKAEELQEPENIQALARVHLHLGRFLGAGCRRAQERTPTTSKPQNSSLPSRLARRQMTTHWRGPSSAVRSRWSSNNLSRSAKTTVKAHELVAERQDYGERSELVAERQDHSINHQPLTINHALDFLRRAESLHPESPGLHTVLGFCHYLKKDWEASRDALLKHLAAVGEKRFTHSFLLASVSSKLGYKDDAAKWFKHGLSGMTDANVGRTGSPALRRAAGCSDPFRVNWVLTHSTRAVGTWMKRGPCPSLCALTPLGSQTVETSRFQKCG